MARKKRSKELQPNIKVRLDRRTIITVRDRSKLDFWREKYPNLEILEESYDQVEEIPVVPSRRKGAVKKPAVKKPAVKKPAVKKPAKK